MSTHRLPLSLGDDEEDEEDDEEDDDEALLDFEPAAAAAVALAVAAVAGFGAAPGRANGDSAADAAAAAVAADAEKFEVPADLKTDAAEKLAAAVPAPNGCATPARGAAPDGSDDAKSAAASEGDGADEDDGDDKDDADEDEDEEALGDAAAAGAGGGDFTAASFLVALPPALPLAAGFVCVAATPPSGLLRISSKRPSSSRIVAFFSRAALSLVSPGSTPATT